MVPLPTPLLPPPLLPPPLLPPTAGPDAAAGRCKVGAAAGADAHDMRDAAAEDMWAGINDVGDDG
jgi:hypothetical protein